ncbi:ubiquitin carboxyl-terminal hydrolase 16 [Rhinophrynus dorsalis]
MVKKRQKNNQVQEPLDTEPVCRHLRKGLEEGAVKKALVNVEWTVCQDCQADSKGKENSEDEPAEEASIWLCLKCGHRGCGRNSEQQHALNHYNTPRSEPHCLVLNFDMWSAWCYLCDSEVPYNRSSRLGQLVDFIQRKAKSNGKSHNSVSLDQEVNTIENLMEKDNTIEPKVEDSNIPSKGNKATNTLSDSKEFTVKGLSNLGNTCFFNAVMQNLSQTPALRELLNEVKASRKAVTVQLPDSSPSAQMDLKLEQQPGPLTLAMCLFLTEMQETKKGVVTPKELFSQVCKKAIRFKGYQQQDSQELLRYLLDGMRGEEIQRISVALTKALQNTSEKIIDEEDVKKKVKDCEKRRAIPNFVDHLFGGELTSTVMCDECHTVSLVHEPFLDLSLPVLDDLLVKKNSPKTMKAAQEIKEEEDDDDDDDSYIKKRNDLSAGTSKHLQKKAKKQAKKQAKNQRRQQKIQEKTLTFTDLSTEPGEKCYEEMADNNTEIERDSKQADETLTEAHCLSNNNSATCAESLEHSSEMDVGNLEKNSGVDENHLDNNTKVDEQYVQNVTQEESQNVENNSEIQLNNIGNDTGIDTENMENILKMPVVMSNGDADHVCVNGDDEVQEETSDNLNDNAVTSLCVKDELTNHLNKLSLSPDLEPNQIEIEIIDDHEKFSTRFYEVVNEDPKVAFCTLSDRKDLQPDECSVLSCLYRFTHKENLTGNNQLLCNVCTKKHASRQKNNNTGEKKLVYTNAKKQMLVSVPPPILTLHLKRFQQNGFNLHKINKHIPFPEVIDLAPFCTVKCKNIPEGESRLLYSLYGVIEHSGTMRSGHYTAYVKSRSPNPKLCDMVLRGVIPQVSSIEPTRGHWYHISDSHVQAVSIAKVLSSQAYLLFYERIL